MHEMQCKTKKQSYLQGKAKKDYKEPQEAHAYRIRDTHKHTHMQTEPRAHRKANKSTNLT